MQRAGAVVLGVMGVLGVACLAAPYTVDDAFIVARYAQNLAAGHGYAMNPDVPSDGITGPLWIVPPLLAVWLGVEPVAALKVVGALCAALTAWLIVRWAGSRALGTRAAWASTLVLVCLPDIGTWSVSGLETGAALLALTLLGHALVSRQPRFGHAALATMALGWLRPELAPCVIVLWIAPVGRAPRAALPWAAVALAGALSVIAWRLAMFGHALPLSASAKPADLGNGVEYVLTTLVLMTSVVGAVLAGLGAKRGWREDRFLGAALLTHFVAIGLAGGDWMPGGRLIVPVMGFYALLVGRGVARLALRKPRIAIACALIAVSVPVLDLAVRIPDLRSNASQREGPATKLGRALAAAGGPLAVLDVGYLGYASGLEVVDLGGLTDDHIADLPGGHIDKQIGEAYLRSRAPRLIVLHSSRAPDVDGEGRLLAFSGYPVEHRVAAMAWVREAFRVRSYAKLNPSYGYVVLERADSPVR